MTGNAQDALVATVCLFTPLVVAGAASCLAGWMLRPGACAPPALPRPPARPAALVPREERDALAQENAFLREELAVARARGGYR